MSTGKDTSTAAGLPAALSALFPPDRLLLAAEQLDAWAMTTHPLNAAPAGLVLPLTVAEVRQAVLAAQQNGVQAMAISRGRNVGLGARLPPTATGRPLIIDLQLLRSIRILNEQFGVIVVEPGVTFQDLHAELRRRGSRWFLPATGGPPDGSIVGNLLERGDGTGPYGDRARAFLDLEAVLPTGEVVYTARDAAGPDISGLFFQSNAGIVTAVSLTLARLPHVMTRFVMHLDKADRLARMVDAAAAATRDGILLPGAVCIWNGTKRLIRAGGGEVTDGWVMTGSMHAASRRRAEADWADLGATFAAAGATLEVTQHEFDEAPSGSGLLAGEPSDANLVSIVSGQKGPDGIPGFAWFCPVLPFDGATAEVVMALVEEELTAAGMPPNMALGCRDARTIRAYVALAWDRSDAAAEARARRAHDRLLTRLDAAGLPPFRLGQLSQDWSGMLRGDTKAVIRRLMDVLAS